MKWKNCKGHHNFNSISDNNNKVATASVTSPYKYHSHPECLIGGVKGQEFNERPGLFAL